MWYTKVSKECIFLVGLQGVTQDQCVVKRRTRVKRNQTNLQVPNHDMSKMSKIHWYKWNISFLYFEGVGSELNGVQQLWNAKWQDVFKCVLTSHFPVQKSPCSWSCAPLLTDARLPSPSSQPSPPWTTRPPRWPLAPVPSRLCAPNTTTPF